MALTARAREFEPTVQVGATAMEPDAAHLRRASELAEATRLSENKRVQASFDSLFPNIANSEDAQKRLAQMIEHGTFDPMTTAAYIILRDHRVIKPQLVGETLGEVSRPSSSTVQEEAAKIDSSTFIG
jgi:hypothetical protein